MGSILEKIEQAIKDLLIGWIESNLTNMFTDVNDKVGTIASEVGRTPSAWNSGIYTMIRGLSENVIVPIAGIIITFVLCYELISMITEKNNMHDMDTWMFFKWFFKAAVAIYLVTNTFDIVMAVFDIGQNVVAGAAGVIHGNTSIDIQSTLDQMRTGMEAMGIGELLGLSIETMLISLCLKIMSILITVILYGRMIEIYCTVSVAPIPIATMSNREWGSIGTNYLKGLFALAFQGFLIMVCVGIYTAVTGKVSRPRAERQIDGEAVLDKAAETSAEMPDFGGDTPTSSRIERLERKSQKAHERLDAAREKLPTKKVLKKERVFDEEMGKGKTRLHFEDELKVPKGQSKLRFEADKTVRKVGDTLAAGIHGKIHEVEQENSGVEAAHRTEIVAESAVRHYQHHKERSANKPFEKVSKLEQKAEAADRKLHFEKTVAENPEMKTSRANMNRHYQKQHIKKEYAAARKAGAQTASTATKSTGKTVREKASDKVKEFFSKNKKVFAWLGAGLMLLILLSAGISSCTAMFTSTTSSVIATSYLSEDDAMLGAEAQYCQMEAELQEYPRTDSQFITDDMGGTARQVIGIVCRKLPLFEAITHEPDIERITNNAKVTDHHAIIPTVQLEKQDLRELPETEQKIIRLVAMRLLCATGEKHIYDETSVTLICEGYEFKAKGKTVVQDGWKAVERCFKETLKSKEKDEPEHSLPSLSEKDILSCVDTSVTEHYTSPPKPYTEDSLLSAMETAGNAEFDDDTEKKGLGTPATRAGIIEKLVKGGFIERKGKSLIPTKDGNNLVCVLPEQITSPSMTAEWENTLMQIERGKADADKFLSGIVEMTSGLVKAYPFLSEAEASRFDSGRESIGKCPRCGSPVYVGKGNYYCSNRECSFCMWEDNKFFTSKKKKLTKKIASELLDKGWCRVTGLYTPKRSQLYDAVIRLNDTGGKYVGFKMEFDK